MIPSVINNYNVYVYFEDVNGRVPERHPANCIFKINEKYIFKLHQRLYCV